MNRNTIFALVAILLILAGTIYWRYTGYKENVRRQQQITSALERTEGNHYARLAALDSIIAAYPEDDVIQRVARYQVLRAHDEMGSPLHLITAAANEFLTADSSGAAMNYVASVYAGNDIPGADGLSYAKSALRAAQEMEQPKNLNPEQWAEQRRLMIGEALHILGKLQMTNADLAGARATLEAAVDSVPDSPNFLRTLAGVYEETGNRTEALERYMDVVRLKYEDEEARAGIATLYPKLYGYRTPIAMVLDTLVANARTARRESLLADTVRRLLPRFQLTGPNGRTYSADSLRGGVIVINTWATWCVPCEKLLPRVQQAYDRYGRDGEASFIAVSFDQETDKVQPYLDRNGYTFPVAYGDRALYDALGVQGIPTTIIADTSGTIRFEHLGYSDVGNFEEELGWQIEAARSMTE